MKEIQLTGALEGLAVLDVTHFARYRAAVAAGGQMGWAYYFPYLLSRHRAGRRDMLLAEDGGSICVFVRRIREGKPRLDLYLAPAPMNVAVVERCLERANDFNGDVSARVMRIDGKDVDAISSVRRLRVRPRKEQYIYDPKAYGTLGGSRFFRTIRRNVARIDSLPDVEVMPYSESHADACLELLHAWKASYAQAHDGTAAVGGSSRAIELLHVFPDDVARGEVVFVDGRLAAYAFGGEIRPGLGCLFESKSDNAIRGLNYHHLRSFLSNLQEFDLVNSGSDAGRAGLREMKDSFRPVEMHVEYQATQRRA